MPEIAAMFWDVGGVLLTNGWDRQARRQAVERFELDAEEFEDRHELVVSDFETGRLSLDRYLERTVFYRPRRFGPDDLKTFMFAQSQPYAERLAIVVRLARSRRYLLGTLNNESTELNRYRIERFRLCEYFSVFISSCCVGLRKPDEAIYRLAVDVTQCRPDRCLFIDDRAVNVESAAKLGMRTIHYQDPDQLQRELRRLGVHGVAEAADPGTC